jgi:hypothetical protein
MAVAVLVDAGWVFMRIKADAPTKPTKPTKSAPVWWKGGFAGFVGFAGGCGFMCSAARLKISCRLTVL